MIEGYVRQPALRRKNLLVSRGGDESYRIDYRAFCEQTIASFIAHRPMACMAFLRKLVGWHSKRFH